MTSASHCPACDTQSLARSPLADALGQADAYDCKRCHGLWLGSNAYETLVSVAQQDEALRNASADDTELVPQPLATDSPVVYRRCPVCRETMGRRLFGPRLGVIVDVCFRDGLWFDRGELERVLPAIASGQRGPVAKPAPTPDASIRMPLRTRAGDGWFDGNPGLRFNHALRALSKLWRTR